MSTEVDHLRPDSSYTIRSELRRHRRQNDGWPRGYRRRGGRRSTGPPPPLVNVEGLLAAAKNAVDTMPKASINSDDQGCGICLEELEVGVEATKMPCDCKHSYYHSLCLQNWLATSASCPFCKSPVKLVFPADDSDQD